MDQAEAGRDLREQLALAIGNAFRTVDLGRAETLVRDAQARFPGDLRFVLEGVKLSLLRSDLAAARPVLEDLVRTYPHLQAAGLYLAQTLEGQGEIDRAVDVCRETLRDRPAHWRLLSFFVRVASRARRFDDARRFFAELPPETAAHPLLRFQAARIDDLSGRRRMALPVYAALAESFPDWLYAQFTFAEALFLDGRADEACARFAICAGLPREPVKAFRKSSATEGYPCSERLYAGAEIAIGRFPEATADLLASIGHEDNLIGSVADFLEVSHLNEATPEGNVSLCYRAYRVTHPPPDPDPEIEVLRRALHPSGPDDAFSEFMVVHCEGIYTDPAWPPAFDAPILDTPARRYAQTVLHEIGRLCAGDPDRPDAFTRRIEVPDAVAGGSPSVRALPAYLEALKACLGCLPAAAANDRPEFRSYLRADPDLRAMRAFADLYAWMAPS